MDVLTCCCCGSFTTSDQVQLVLASESHIGLWGQRQQSARPVLVHRQRAHCTAAVVTPFRVPGWLQDGRDGLAAISASSSDLQLLCWNNQKQGLQELCHIPNALPNIQSTHDRIQTSQAIALGSSLCCVISGGDGRLTVAMVKKNEKGPIRFCGTFHEVPPTHDGRSGGLLGSSTQILSLSFLTDWNGCPEVDLHGRPLLAQLVREIALDGSVTSFFLSALDVASGELHRCWQLRDLEPSTRVLLTSASLSAPSPEKRAEILLLSSSGGIAYDRNGCFCKRIRYETERSFITAAQLSENLLIVGDAAGALQAVDLSMSDSARPLRFEPEPAFQLHSGLRALLPFAQEPDASTFVSVRENGQTSLIRYPGGDSACSIRHVPSTELPGLAPVHDFTAVHVSPQEAELVLAHGSARHGCLTRVQEAAELMIREALTIEHQGLGLPALLPFSLPSDRPAVVLSYENSSRVLHLCDDATWRPLTASAFDETLRTLAVGAVGVGRAFVQVTSAGLRLVASSPPYDLLQELDCLKAATGKATRGQKLFLADVRNTRVVVAGTDELRTFEVDASGGLLREGASRKNEQQISAVGLSVWSGGMGQRRASHGEASTSGAALRSGPDAAKKRGGKTRRAEPSGMQGSGRQENDRPQQSEYVVVGFWTSHVVEVLRWSDLEMVTRVQLGGSDLPRSVKLVASEGVNALFIGTGEGSLLCYEGRSEGMEDIHTGPGWHVRVGSGPVSLSMVSGQWREESADSGGFEQARSSQHMTKKIEHGSESSEKGKRTEYEAESGHGVGVVGIFAQSYGGVFLGFDNPSSSETELATARVIGAEGLHHVAAWGDATWLVVGEDGQIRTASLDRKVKVRRQSFPLGVTPRMVACHVSRGCLAAVCARDRGADSLRVLHARTLASLADVSLRKGHVPTCLHSVSLPLQKVDRPDFDSYGAPEDELVTGEFLVLASTVTGGEHAVSVLSVFDVEESPAGDDRVAFRLFLLGSYATGAVVCSMASVLVPPAEASGTIDEASEGPVSARIAESASLLAVGTHEGLQVLSLTVDRAGAAAVADLEERAVLAALAESNGKGVNVPAGDMPADPDTNSARDPDGNTEADESVSIDEPKSHQVGLLQVKVAAEIKLPAGVTGLQSSGNVLFAALADGSLLLLETVQTSTGVRLVARSQRRFKAPPASLFAVSPARVLVYCTGRRRVSLLERDLAAEAAYEEKEKRTAVRISEAGGLDLSNPTGNADIQMSGCQLKELEGLPLLEMRDIDYAMPNAAIGFCKLLRKLGASKTETGEVNVVLQQDLFAVLADGTVETLPSAMF